MSTILERRVDALEERQDKTDLAMSRVVEQIEAVHREARRIRTVYNTVQDGFTEMRERLDRVENSLDVQSAAIGRLETSHNNLERKVDNGFARTDAALALVQAGIATIGQRLDLLSKGETD